MKLLYETLNQASLVDSNRLYHHGIREFSPLEPRRSNPLDRYQVAEYFITNCLFFLMDTCFIFYREQWQIPSSKQGTSDYHASGGQTTQHNPSYHEIREHIGKS